MLVLVVGPSGAGKDTLLDAVRVRLAGDDGIRFARREITRPVTPGGEQHIAVDTAQFTHKRDAGGYALWWEAHGLAYGIGVDILVDLAAGRTVVASVSRAIVPDAASRFAVKVVEVTAPPDVLATRLAARGREGVDDIARRLSRQVGLPAHVPHVTVMNDSTIEEGMNRLLAALI
jgi:phosphonate metabolism protein PhnN/1,5-bisphosphokinase (PRPP-forming)